MELPYHLQTLEPLTGALDIIRYLGSIEEISADSDDIAEALDLSERTADKAIRRLVTKGYLQMDAARAYRLTNQGHEAVEILAEYDSTNPQGESNHVQAISTVVRRLIVALPSTFVAGQAATVAVGLDGATDDETGVLYNPADMVVRLSVVNGEPAKPQETILKLSNYPVKHAFNITPGNYDQVRVRVQVFQMGPNPDDINVSGGLYVDTHVIGTTTPITPIAYGSDVEIQVSD